MTKYVASFDDVSKRIKRLSKVFVSVYASADLYNIQANTIIGAEASTNFNAEDAALIIGVNSSTNHLFLQSRSNTNHPCLNFERRRDNGATVQSGDKLGEIRFFAATSNGWQSPSVIKSVYAGNGATFLSTLEFYTSGNIGAALNHDSSFILYNGSNHSVSLRVGATSANYNWVFPLAQGSANQLLANDGSGNLSFVYPSHNILLNRDAADCHPTSAITNFTTDVNNLITSYFSNFTDYGFDADATGTTTFDLGFSIVSRKVYVSENGVLKREGATYDYQKSGSEVVFNYTVQNSWVNVSVSDVGATDHNYDVDNTGQTTFNTGSPLGTKRVSIYENGQMKREGASFDFTRSGNNIVFNYTVRNAWVLIIVYI